MLSVRDAPSRGHWSLTQADYLRLVRIADLFDVHYKEARPGTYEFNILEKDGWRRFELGADTAPVRLLTELGSKTVRWVYFHPGEHCGKTLLSLTDKKLERIGELYQRWKSKGFPE